MLFQLLQQFHAVFDPLLFFVFGPIDPHDGITTLSELVGLKRLATALEVSVIVGGALPAGWWGAFHAPSRTVTMREGLPAYVFRSVLAHELGHAHYGHTGTARHDSQQERMADRFAARHLIDPEDFFRACTLHGLTDIEALAVELNVMTWVVREYMQTRTGIALADRWRNGSPNVIHITDYVTTEPLILGNNMLR